MVGEWDLIIGCEVLYLREFYEALVSVLERHSRPSTRVLICWQELSRELAPFKRNPE